eukprot:g18456.t1
MGVVQLLQLTVLGILAIVALGAGGALRKHDERTLDNKVHHANAGRGVDWVLAGSANLAQHHRHLQADLTSVDSEDSTSDDSEDEDSEDSTSVDSEDSSDESEDEESEDSTSVDSEDSSEDSEDEGSEDSTSVDSEDSSDNSEDEDSEDSTSVDSEDSSEDSEDEGSEDSTSVDSEDSSDNSEDEDSEDSTSVDSEDSSEDSEDEDSEDSTSVDSEDSSEDSEDEDSEDSTSVDSEDSSDDSEDEDSEDSTSVDSEDSSEDSSDESSDDSSDEDSEDSTSVDSEDSSDDSPDDSSDDSSSDSSDSNDGCTTDEDCDTDIGEICCPEKHVCEDPVSPGACGDPHMTGFRGQKFDFTGDDGGWYSVLSHLPDIHLNMRVTSPVSSLPEITYITGVSIKTTDSDGTEHTITISVTNPHSLDSMCPEGQSPCLADGALTVELDGETALLAPGMVSLGPNVAIAAANLPGACRSFGFEKYWERKKAENAMMGRRLSEQNGLQDMSEWILGDPTATNMDECTEYVADAIGTGGETGLFSHDSEHTSFQILTPMGLIRLSHGRLHQLPMRDPTDRFDLPDHLTWQMNLAIDHHDLDERVARGILGETLVPTVDAKGKPIMQGMGSIRGSEEDYRVEGPQGTAFAQDMRHGHHG